MLVGADADTDVSSAGDGTVMSWTGTSSIASLSAGQLAYHVSQATKKQRDAQYNTDHPEKAKRNVHHGKPEKAQRTPVCLNLSMVQVVLKGGGGLLLVPRHSPKIPCSSIDQSEETGHVANNVQMPKTDRYSYSNKIQPFTDQTTLQDTPRIPVLVRKTEAIARLR